MSNIPPNERALVGKPSITLIASPLSLAHSIFSKREKSIRKLAKAKEEEKKLQHT